MRLRRWDSGGRENVSRTESEGRVGVTHCGQTCWVLQGISDPAVLEALACREALALASDLHVRKIKVASDCLEVINSMQTSYVGKFSVILKEIKVRSFDFVAASFVH